MVSGAGLSLAAARHFIRRLAFIRNSAVAGGVVVALREERDGMDTQRVRFPRVRFRTASGRDVTFEAGMARGGAAWQIGEAVSVRYRVDHPEMLSSTASWRSGPDGGVCVISRCVRQRRRQLMVRVHS